jgi:hypothetical protein
MTLPAEAVPAPQAELPAVPEGAITMPQPNGAGELQIPVAPQRVFSYGTATTSLMLTPHQLKNMMIALSTFESVVPDEKNTMPEEPKLLIPKPETVEAPKIEEPKTYPAFYLSSIAYRSAKDWTVWVNRIRINPKNNEGEVRVTRVTPDRVWFVWEPSYKPAFNQRIREKKFEPSDDLRHRVSKESGISYNEKTGVVSFSLRPNQTFAPAYYSSFEGKVEASSVPTLDRPDVAPMSEEDAGTISELLGTPTGMQPTNILPPTQSPPPTPVPPSNVVPNQPNMPSVSLPPVVPMSPNGTPNP